MADKSGLGKLSNNISQSDMLRMTTEVVSAYVGNTKTPVAKIPDVISSVFGALQTLDNGLQDARARLKPAVPIRKSLIPR